MADFNEYKGVWVFCEQRQGALMSTDFELVSEARKLADELGCEVTGLLLGDNVEGIAKELGGYGADKVLVCESSLLKDYTTDAYAKVVCDMVNEYKPEVLLIGATNIGRDLGPRCAARLHTGLTADATHLDIDTAKYVEFLKESSTIDLSKQKFDYEDRNLKMTRPAFGGHLMATIICPRFRPQMSTVRPGVMKKAPFDQAKADACQIVKPAFSLTADDVKTEVLSVEKAAEKLVDLIGADVIVSVGRGISKDVNKGIELAEQLAAALGGGVVGASRAVTDAGWMPLTIRWVRPVRPSTPRSMWLWASPARSSTPQVCRIPSASSPSTRTSPPPSSAWLTTASLATCSRSFPNSSSRSRQQRLLSDRLRNRFLEGSSKGLPSFFVLQPENNKNSKIYH